MLTETITKENIKDEMKNVFLKRASVKKSKLNKDMVLHEIVDDNLFKLGHILLDLHETFKLTPEYEPLSEFEMFHTVDDVEKYFCKKLIKE